jgi:RND family efflux transporter MFP subunit
MKRIYWIIGIVVVVLAAGAFGVKKWLLPAKAATAATQTVKVTVGSVSTSVSGSGTVRSGQGSNITWQTSGTVAAVPVQIGQQVNKGDELAALDATSISSSIIQAQSDLISAQTALDNLLHPTALALAQAQAALTTAQDNLNNLLNPTALAIAQADTGVQDAQTALDNLQHPTALAIAQAQSTLADAQTALDNLQHPNPQAIAQAQTAVNTDQTAMTNAQAAVDRLKYARGTQAQIDAAQAAYVVAQSVVDRLQKVYEGTPGDPTQDPVKAQALSALQTAITKRDQALTNLNYLTATWSATDIQDRTTALALAQAQLATDQKTLNDLQNPTADSIAVAQGKVNDAQTALDKLNHPTEVDIALAQAQVTNAQDALTKLKNPTAVDIELAKQQVADAQKTLDTLQNPTADQITVAQSRVTLAEATLGQMKITAPFTGTVTNVQTLVGDIVSTGNAAFRIDDLSKEFVDVQVSEVDISQIKVGQKAALTFDAIAGKTYNGVVSKVVLAGSVSQGVVNYPVTIQITDADASVLPGMTASVTIIVAQHDNVLLVPNRAIHTSGGQRTVTVLFQGQQISVPVTVGLIGTSYTEVSGTSLKEGDEVVITVSTASSTSSSGATRFQGGGGGGVFFGP